MSERDPFYKELVTEKLVSFMEEHDKVARRQITDLGCLGDDVFNNLWKDLSTQLNTIAEAFGITPKATAKWIEFWNNARLEARQRASEFLKHQVRSTGNIPNPILLSDHEIRINAIFGKAGLGLSIIPEFGFKSSNNRVNPIDLFDEFFPKSKMANRESTSVSPLQKALIVKTMAEPDNIKFALGLESDPQKRMSILTSLVTRLNAIKPGAVKDYSQWQSTWDNMWRHCYASISPQIDPNRFLSRVHHYRNQSNQLNQARSQETVASDATDKDTFPQVVAKKRISSKQTFSRVDNKKSKNVDEDLIAFGFLPNPSADGFTDYQKFQATCHSPINESSATACQTKSGFSPRAACFFKDRFPTYQENSFENLPTNFTIPPKTSLSSSSSWIPEPNSRTSGTPILTSTTISKEQYNNNSASTSTSQVLDDERDTLSLGTSTAGMINAPTMQSFTDQSESSRLDKPTQLADITVDEFRKMIKSDLRSVLDEKLTKDSDKEINKSSIISNEGMVKENQNEQVPQKLPNVLQPRSIDANFTNQQLQIITFEECASNNETSTSSPSLYLSDGDYLTEEQFNSLVEKLNNNNNNQ